LKINALNVVKCIPNIPLPADLAQSFYLVMNVPGILTTSSKDSGYDLLDFGYE
jgi:hypothetical protein